VLPLHIQEGFRDPESKPFFGSQFSSDGVLQLYGDLIDRTAYDAGPEARRLIAAGGDEGFAIGGELGLPDRVEAVNGGFAV